LLVDIEPISPKLLGDISLELSVPFHLSNQVWKTVII